MTLQPEPTLIEFFYYNQWANQQLMAICMVLAPVVNTKIVIEGETVGNE